MSVTGWVLGLFHILVEKGISLVLPLSIHWRECSHRSHEYSRWKRLACWLMQVNWQNWLLFYIFLRHFKISHPVKWMWYHSTELDRNKNF